MKKLIALSVLSAVTSFSAIAEQPSFNYVEAGYTSSEDFDGYEIKSNIAINKNFFIDAEYKNVSLEERLPSGEEVTGELDFVTLGIGYNAKINSNTAFFTRLAYAETNSKVDFTNFDESFDGYLAGLGVRSMISQQTELYGELTHLNIDSDAQTNITLGARQKLTDKFALYAEYEANDFGSDGYSVGATYNF